MSKGNKLSYEEWLAKVDEILWESAGMPSSDLPDVNWMDEYLAGSTPKTAIKNLSDGLEIGEYSGF